MECVEKGGLEKMTWKEYKRLRVGLTENQKLGSEAEEKLLELIKLDLEEHAKHEKA